ncbi:MULTISPECIES: Rha family transcriptional regulator [Bacillus cereus group]|uniref:Rha family transcriptional regulator n=1 Tax=Bacillus cereus group TaxID=86661 RepID=UPI001F561BFB|nr:Rha family transcriptional regulator [Bacillus cereus group sp. BfR-BA-01522]
MNSLQSIQEPISHLVFIDGDAVVTDSLTVAEVFDKEHAKVIRSIEGLQCSKEFAEANFGVSVYRDRSGKRNKKYLLKRDGLMFLIMGYTGEKAAKFKEMFINEFNRMEEYIKQKQTSLPTSREQLVATLKLTLTHEEDLSQIKTEMQEIKNDLNQRMTVDYSQQTAIRNAVSRRVYKVWDEGIVNKNIHDTRRKVFSAIWKDVYARFAVNSYHNVRQKDFEEVIDYIKVWRPRLV